MSLAIAPQSIYTTNDNDEIDTMPHTRMHRSIIEEVEKGHIYTLKQDDVDMLRAKLEEYRDVFDKTIGRLERQMSFHIYFILLKFWEQHKHEEFIHNDPVEFQKFSRQVRISISVL